MKNRSRLRTFLFRTIIVVLIAWVVAMLALCITGMRMPYARADVAVIFGNKLNPDGRPSPVLSDRLDIGVHCYRAGECAKLFVSGGIDGPGLDEGASMRRYLIERGVPDENIIVDDQGNNTLATAYNAAAWMRAHHLSSVLLVSQYYHLPRARLSFVHAGIDEAHIYGAWPHVFKKLDLYSSWREVPAFLLYKIRLALNPDAKPVTVRPLLYLKSLLFH